MLSQTASRFNQWNSRHSQTPGTLDQVIDLLFAARNFAEIPALNYGDHGLAHAERVITEAIRANRRIALYADYDVDGTMSCVSWIWFLEALGYRNFIHYIPCRFSEGYGLNLNAVKYLIHEKGAEVIITMDTGITANQEAAYCASVGVDFICTDHHKIQPEKMPQCVILNPKQHPDPDYQELCGAGITFVLLRRLSQTLVIDPEVWTDILALVGMATICDVVPLNPVNHKLAKMGVKALIRSKRPVLVKLRQATTGMELDEVDVGFRLGPRINAVGRLEHADAIIEAFTGTDPEPLIAFMESCNEERKRIQKSIVDQATLAAQDFASAPILFLGGDWHHGVVGIAASKLAEKFWRPVWLYSNSQDRCRGSARSIPGFDVTNAMSSAAGLFEKFGGHAAAGGFSFMQEHSEELRNALTNYALVLREASPDLWLSKISYDFTLPLELLSLELVDALDGLRPFGHGFAEPLFKLIAPIEAVQSYPDKETGLPKHTALTIGKAGRSHKVMFFNEVLSVKKGQTIEILATIGKNIFRGRRSISVIGKDWRFATSAPTWVPVSRAETWQAGV